MCFPFHDWEIRQITPPYLPGKKEKLKENEIYNKLVTFLPEFNPKIPSCICKS